MQFEELAFCVVDATEMVVTGVNGKLNSIEMDKEVNFQRNYGAASLGSGKNGCISRVDRVT